MRNDKRAIIDLGDGDALLIQALLRDEWLRFKEARNEVMTGVLDRAEEAFEKAQTELRTTNG